MVLCVLSFLSLRPLRETAFRGCGWPRLAGRFGLSAEDANAVADEIRQGVGACWRDQVLAAGGFPADCDTVARAFRYEGFEPSSDPR